MTARLRSQVVLARLLALVVGLVIGLPALAASAMQGALGRERHGASCGTVAPIGPAHLDTVSTKGACGRNCGHHRLGRACGPPAA